MIGQKKGFSLIELMAVVAIIAMLSAAALTIYTNSQKKARDARRQADRETVRSALELYRTDSATHNYPNPAGANGSNAKYTALSAPLLSYVNPLPQDPRNGVTYYYTYSYSAVGPTYTICVSAWEVAAIPAIPLCVSPP